MKKKPLKLQKAANGLQKIQASQAGERGLVAGGLTAGANALLPGSGAAVGLLEGLSSTLKDENGLYKSKGGQLLDQLNPVTAIGRTNKLIGGLFSGKLFKGNPDLDGQQEIKDAISKQKMKDTQAATWGRSTMDTASMSQMSQYKQGTSSVKSKAIEIEGGEPHFSKKVNGKRTLIGYSPQGPSHEEGGIPILASAGDAIVTKQGGLGAKAVEAHLAGNDAAVEKIINQMPTDTKKKTKAKGVKKVDPQVLAAQQKLNQNGYSLKADGIMGDHTQAALDDYRGRNALLSPKNLLEQPLPGVPTTLQKAGGFSSLPTSTPFSVPQNVQTAGNNLLQAAPTIYNLGQGLFGSTAKTTRRSFNPTTLQYEDLSAPTRNAITQGVRGNVANARNVSAGNAGNIRANTAQAYATGVTQTGAVNAQEAGRKMEINNTNVGILNDAKLRNNAMNDYADNLDLQNAAKKQEALSKGLEGISGLAANSQLMGNQKAADAANLSNLGQMFRNMEMVNGKWQVKKAKKGIKKVI